MCKHFVRACLFVCECLSNCVRIYICCDFVQTKLELVYRQRFICEHEREWSGCMYGMCATTVIAMASALTVSMGAQEEVK